jgi:hypothetical protein
MSRAAIFVLLIVSIVLCCQGCARYETHEDKFGRTIRTDRWTGEVAILEGDTLVKVKSSEEVKRDNAALASPHQWADIAVPQLGDGVIMHLTTNWRDGQMFYRFEVRPASERMYKSLNSGGRLDISFIDSNGFKSDGFSIPLTKLARVLDDQGKPIALTDNDSRSVTHDDYLRIARWEFGWAGL